MADKTLYTHNPDSFTFSIGSHLIQGYADDSMIKVMRNNDSVTLKVGVKGAGSRSISQDYSGRFEITLFPGTPSNTFLNALADADQTTGLGTLPAQLVDLNGRMFAHTEACWVVKKPDADVQKEVTSRTWILECANLEYFASGQT
jgi:hypothetical protein